MEQFRKCEICGKTDSKTMVCGSTLGPFSQDICEICAVANAEDKYMLEAGIGVNRAHTYYVPEQDKYFYFISNKVVVFFPDSIKLEKRSDLVKFLKEKRGTSDNL